MVTEVADIGQVAQRGPRHPAREFWDYFRANHGAVGGLAVIVALLLLAAFAGAVAPHSPIATHNDAFLRPPVWESGGSWTYPLGTDAIGRDILSRIIHGSRLSLLIGTLAVSIAFLAGVTLGLVAGFF